MKHPLLAFAAILVATTTAHAIPPAVGAISDDVGFSEGSAFNGTTYATLSQRHLSDYPDKVLALVYYTPW